MKVVFFGTPEYVIPVLAALAKNFKIVGVVTQPPRPVGRGRKLAYSAVDTWAYKHKVPVMLDLTKVPEADLAVLAAYGKIVPQSIIDKFKHGILNIHPSLLPKYRGASPVQAAIMNGDSESGVSIIKLDGQMDHGPIISQFKEHIQDQDTTEILRKRLFERSAQFLIDLIPNYLNKKIIPKEQNHKEATFTKILKREDGFVEFEKIDEADKAIRALNPWPGVWTYVKINGAQKRLKVLDKDKVQLEGKNPVTLAQFKEAYRFF